MSDHGTGKERLMEERERERALKARAQTEPRDDSVREDRRKPSPIERREWRGSGVCGDRHTD
jgi:hypothetical protein